MDLRDTVSLKPCGPDQLLLGVVCVCLAHSYVWKKDNVVIAPSSSSRVVVETS